MKSTLRKAFQFLLLILFSPSLFAQKTEIKYLSGIDKDRTVEWDFFCTKGRNSGKWGKIPVPSNWEMQGYGTYHYGWEENFKENETGLYKFNFKSEPSWKDKTVRLVFEGSMTDTEVKINGKLAGPIHQGSFYRFKYDISKLIKEDNLLEVKVDKISSDTSVNRAERKSDFWVFGGIYRPVYIEVLPKQFIDWTAVDARADGSFRMDVYPMNVSDANQIEGQIMNLKGEAVGAPFSISIKKGQEKTTIQTKIENPELWNPEDPHLYHVEIRLKNQKGTIHSVVEKFGFRTVEFKEGNGFFVNGRKIIFKGSNRHSFWPTTGRTTSKEISILDVNLMKDMNMNSVRMSHYPPDAHFLDVCDSLGLFVLDELTGWQKKYDTPVGRKLLKEMVMKDVNHPSIVVWDNGNEGGNNFDLDDDFAIYDPQKRHVIHPWNVFRGTDTQHYRGYDCCAGSLYHGDKVFFPTEILHGLYDGGHGAGLNDHWNLMMKNPLSAGCFLWAYADEGITRTDLDSVIDVKGNSAPDGIVGPYREKEGSFYTIKEIWSPVQIKEEQLMEDFNGIMTLENHFIYTNLSKVKFDWKLMKLPFPSQSSEAKVLYKGTAKSPDIEPHSSGKLQLELPSDFKSADMLYLTATDPFEREIFTWSWPLKTPQQLNKQLVVSNEKSKITVREDAGYLYVKANKVEVKFDKKTGLFKGATNSKGNITFTDGPVLTPGKQEFKSLKRSRIGDSYVIEMFYTGELKSVKYTMNPSGILKLDYSYSLYDSNPTNEFDYLGITFSYPEDKVTGIKYLGEGPYRVWKNRLKGGQYNVWNKKYNNTITGESWDYPEFKGYYKDFTWVVIETKEQPFTIFTETPGLFLRLYTPARPKGAKNDNNTPPFPTGDISFLNGISPIGTKFDGAQNHGPEGGKNKIGWNHISGVLYFDFRSMD